MDSKTPAAPGKTDYPSPEAGGQGKVSGDGRFIDFFRSSKSQKPPMKESVPPPKEPATDNPGQSRPVSAGGIKPPPMFDDDEMYPMRSKSRGLGKTLCVDFITYYFILKMLQSSHQLSYPLMSTPYTRYCD